MIPAAVIAAARRRSSGGGGEPGGSLSVAHVAGGVVGGAGEKTISGIDLGPPAYQRLVVITFEMESATSTLTVSDVKVGDLPLVRIRNQSYSGAIGAAISTTGGIELWEIDARDYIARVVDLRFTPSSGGQTTRYDVYVVSYGARIDSAISASATTSLVSVAPASAADGIVIATGKTSNTTDDPIVGVAPYAREVSYAGGQQTQHRMATGHTPTVAGTATVSQAATGTQHHKAIVAATYGQDIQTVLANRPSPVQSGLVHHFDADHQAHADPAGTTLAVDGLSVGLWRNRGSGQDAVQNTAERRPTFRTGGLVGKPYLLCDRTIQQYFEDLPFVQPTGVTSINLWTAVAVVDQVDVTSLPAPLTGSNKNHFRITTANQLRMVKTQFVAGATTNPMVAIGRFTLSNVTYNINGTTSSLGNSSNLPSGAETVMRFLRDGTDHFHGRLYEFMDYSRRLTDAEVAFLMSHLMAKYGIA